MTIKQQISNGTIQKVYHLDKVIFTLFTKNNKLWNERKHDFLYALPLQRITLYQRR